MTRLALPAADTVTANRLVLTVGRIFVTDIFDTNKYANSLQDRLHELVVS